MLSHDYNRLLVKEYPAPAGSQGEGVEINTGPMLLPEAFMMFAVGGRTQGIGVIASWYTTHASQSQIDWAITEGFSPPALNEYQTTPWTEDFVKDHEIPFPEVQMNQYHWFFARSRNAAGVVLEAPRRGIYVVPSEFTIESEFDIGISFHKVSAPLLSQHQNTNIQTLAAVNFQTNLLSISAKNSMSEVIVADEIEVKNISNLYTNIIIQ